MREEMQAIRERRRITDKEAQVERNEKGNINEANKL